MRKGHLRLRSAGKIHYPYGRSRVQTAAHFGIDSDRAVNYHADSKGTQALYSAVSDTVCAFRAAEPIAQSWSKKINQDFNSRKKNI